MAYGLNGLPAAMATQSSNHSSRIKPERAPTLTRAVSITLRSDSGMLVVKTVYPDLCSESRNLFAEVVYVFPFRRATTQALLYSD